MQATKAQRNSEGRRTRRAGARKGRVERARSLLLDSGWDESRILPPRESGGLAVIKVAPAGEPRLSVILGEESAARPTSLAYSSESELLIHWGETRITLGQPTRWSARPGDTPGIAGDGDDRWMLEDVFALVGPERLLDGEAEQVSAAGKAHDSLAVRLGNTLAELRRTVAEVEAAEGGELDRALLRFFHQLLFIRVQEDRGAELGPRIDAIYRGPEDELIPRLGDLLAGCRESLNSELFEPAGFPVERVGTAALRPLLKSLVEPWEELNLDFSLSRADLAGRLYQQYLKKTPAVERAGEGRRPRLVPIAVERDEQESTAAYYTPMSAASMLAADTLGAWLGDRAPRKAEEVRLLDPACGSGTFLVAGFHLIREQLEAGGRTLRRAEREAILRESLFGADIDPKAIGITQVQLLEAAELPAGRLPDLEESLFVGDSLALPPAVAGEEERTAEDGVPWREILDRVGGFDAVLMNPPFGAQLRLSGRLEDERRAALRERFPQVAGWGSDLAYYFVALAFSLMREGSCAGMIVPRKILAGKGSAQTRELIESISLPRRIVDFRGLPLFPGALSYVAFLEFIPGRGRIEALDVSDSTVDPGLVLDRMPAGRNGVVRRTRAPRAALRGPWTPFSLRWRGKLSSQLGRDWRPLGEVDEVTVCQGTQLGAQKALTIGEGRWREDEGALEVDGRRVKGRYAPLVAWAREILPLLPPVGSERLLFPFEDDKSVTEDRVTLELLEEMGGFDKRPQPGAVATLRSPKVILRGFGREPAAFADPRGEWITVKGTKGGLALAPADGGEDLLHGMAGLLCSELYQWLLRGLGDPRRDESIEILQMHAEQLPWPALGAAAWRALAERSRDVIDAVAAEPGPERAHAYRARRAALDEFVFELLEVGPALRKTVGAELVRSL
jgi:type I restriction-modification system DNA methylase subunit